MTTGGQVSESALYEVVCPAFYVTRLFGQAPYAYPRSNRPPRLQPCASNCAYSLVWALVYGYVVVMALLRFDDDDQPADRPVLGVTEKSKLILNYLVSLADMAMGILGRKQFTRVWNSIAEFDETYQLGEPVDPGKPGKYGSVLTGAKRWLWFSMAMSFFCWTSINQLGMYAFDEPYLTNLGYMLTYVGTYVAVLKLCGVIFLLGQRFAYLNELASKLMRDKNQRDTLLNMKKIETSYNQLMSSSEELNEAYSYSLFLFLFNLFFHTVCNMYFFMFWTIVNPTYLTNAKVVCCEFSWLLIYLIQLLLLHISCHFTSREANRMGYILLDWRREADRHGNKQNKFQSTLYLLNHKLHFSAAGCMDVNLQLLTTTFGHITTYLVILLQLPGSSEDE